jgi:ADP-ribose pyrophosphatase
MKPWKKVGHEKILAQNYGRKFVSQDFMHPKTEKPIGLSFLDTPHGVRALALTPQKKVILVKEYKQGRDCVDLELPGGGIEEDSNELTENIILENLKRELREETGYECNGTTEYLGYYFVEGRNCNTKLFLYLLQDCNLTSKTEFDENEIIETELVNLNTFIHNILQGEYSDPSMHVALLRASLSLRLIVI